MCRRVLSTVDRRVHMSVSLSWQGVVVIVALILVWGWIKRR